MKIIPIFIAIFLITFQTYHSSQVLSNNVVNQTQIDFDNDANYNFGTTNNNQQEKERKLYQVYNNPTYQAPILQTIPQIQQIPQPQWSVQQPQQYQLNQQPIQYTTQPQQIRLQQQPIIQNQQSQIYNTPQQQIQPSIQQQIPQQQVKTTTRLVDNKDKHEERILQKMSLKNKNYRKLKMKLLKFVGEDRPHYYYQGRYLAQYFCNSHYCSRNLNIFQDNNINRKIKRNQDKRELCQNKCQKIVEDESEYQTRVINKMKSSPQKMRILALFDTIFDDPHFCLNYANNPKHFKKLMCEKQKIPDTKCGIVASVSMQKACNTKKQIFNFHQALIDNQKLRKHDRTLTIDYSYKGFFKSNKPQCSQCRTRSLQYINQFYTFNKQKRLCGKRFKNDYEKKQACSNEMQNQYDRKLQSIENTCQKLCGNNPEQQKRMLKVIKHIPKYVNSENQCNSYCSQQTQKVCNKNESCFSSFPQQCFNKCKFQVQKRQLYMKNTFQQTSEIINIYEYFQKVRSNYDKENEEQIRQMIIYYNRDSIYDAILEMEKQIYEDETEKQEKMQQADEDFEHKLQIKLNTYYKDQDKAMQNLDDNLNIFDIELQFIQNNYYILQFFNFIFNLNIIRQFEMISEDNHNHKTSIKIQLSSNDDQSKTSSDFVSESDTNTQSSEYTNQDQLNPDDILLSDSQQRNYFLTKVSIIMIIYWGASAALQYHMIKNMNLYRKLYWIYKLNSLFWIYLLIFIVFKLTVALIGDFMRQYQKGLFIIDLFITYFVQIGLYFEVNAYLETMYIWDGHYMVIFIYCMFFNSIALLISTLLQPKKDYYKFIIGFILMEISSFLTMLYFFNKYDIIVMGPTRYQIVYSVFTVINLYISYDYSLLLNYRKNKFVESDNIYAFYTLWTDWFSYFWIDLFSRASDMRQKRYAKNYKGNLEALEQDKDGFNDELVIQPANQIKLDNIVDSIIANSKVQIIIKQNQYIQSR